VCVYVHVCMCVHVGACVCMCACLRAYACVSECVRRACVHASAGVSYGFIYCT